MASEHELALRVGEWLPSKTTGLLWSWTTALPASSSRWITTLVVPEDTTRSLTITPYMCDDQVDQYTTPTRSVYLQFLYRDEVASTLGADAERIFRLLHDMRNTTISTFTVAQCLRISTAWLGRDTAGVYARADNYRLDGPL